MDAAANLEGYGRLILTTAPPPTSATALAAYAARWLELNAGAVRPQTLLGYRSIVRRTITFHPIGAITLATLTRSAVRDWLATLLAEGLAPQTAARAHSVLHALLNLALDDDLVVTNVSQGLARRLRRPVRPRTRLDLTQLDFFLETAERLMPDRFALFVALAAAGLRIGEAIALRPEDIHPTEPLIHVQRNLRSGSHIGPPKSGVARTVLVTETAAAILRSVPPHPSGWLFPGRFGTNPVSAHRARLLVGQVAKAAGLPPITPRTFRRSYAGVMRTVGASDSFTADQFGHVSEQTTRRYYLDDAPRAEPPAILRERSRGTR